jgi:3-oxoacyl-[acyl-carrier protein] reductase
MIFTGKVVLVTGSTRGIGKQIADDITKMGGIVIKLGRSHINFLDSEEVVLEKIKKLLEENPRIDILINNVGINYRCNIEDYPLEKLEELYRVNLKAAVLLSREVSKLMIKNGYGRIVNISSISGNVSMPGRSIYSMTKAGIQGFTRGLAMDLARYNILVNSVSPGVTFTDMTVNMLGKTGIEEIIKDIPLGRIAHPKEISNLVLFLCSDLNTYMTGQNLIIDGGYTCK